MVPGSQERSKPNTSQSSSYYMVVASLGSAYTVQFILNPCKNIFIYTLNEVNICQHECSVRACDSYERFRAILPGRVDSHTVGCLDSCPPTSQCQDYGPKHWKALSPPAVGDGSDGNPALGTGAWGLPSGLCTGGLAHSCSGECSGNDHV